MLCNICDIEQSEENFYFHRPGERERRCKACKQKLANRADLVLKRKERQKRHRQTEAGRKGAILRTAKYRKKHPERIKAGRKKWLLRPENRIRVNLSAQLVHLLKGESKSAPFVSLLGCSVSELRTKLEAQFKPGMNWDNYGTFWEVDHKRPCASFNLTQASDQQQCFHWSNLQPLTLSENRSKSDKWA